METSHIAELFVDQPPSAKALAFVVALSELCQRHAVQLSTSLYDGLVVSNLGGDSPIHCNGIEDSTTP